MNVEQHEKALRELSERFRTNPKESNVQEEIKKLLGENGFLYGLKEYLRTKVNGEISPKLKERYNTARPYFELREKIENQIIASEDWVSYFQNIDLTELRDFSNNLSLCSSHDLKTLMLVTIQALKSFIDNKEEESEKCLVIHELYLKLKTSLSSEIPFPSGDSYEEYLGLRNYREEIENARVSGSICPSCGSHDIKSFGQNWKCRTCGREFRKHMQRTED